MGLYLHTPGMKVQIQLISFVWWISAMAALVWLAAHVFRFGLEGADQYVGYLLMWVAVLVASLLGFAGRRWALRMLSLAGIYVIGFWFWTWTNPIDFFEGGPPWWLVPLELGSFLLSIYTLIVVCVEIGRTSRATDRSG